MFTGIIELIGKVKRINRSGANLDIYVVSSISNELKIDQSVSHNGVCLTVVGIGDGFHWVTVVGETLKKSNLINLKMGDKINLERCLKANGRFDGHIVQGHVDTVAKIVSIEDQNGSWLFTFNLKKEGLLVEKGSIVINGISFTCFNVKDCYFSVIIIPYTYEYTNFHQLKINDFVNVEFDIIGKYVHSILSRNL